MSFTPPTTSVANLTDQEDNVNPEAPSPNAMAVDPPEEHVVEPNGEIAADNVDVVIINADDANENEAPEAPLADNCAPACHRPDPPVRAADVCL